MKALNKDKGGIALIAVLVALSLLLALAVPFALSMGFGLDASSHEVDKREARLASESVRNFILHEAMLGHDSIDPDPQVDGRAEFPDRLEIPAALRPGRRFQARLSGEVWDLQRKVDLNSASPLLLGNLLGLATILGQDLEEDGEEIVVADGRGFPERGYLFADGELIRYGSRDGNRFGALTRGLLVDEYGYAGAAGHTVRKGELVLDYRVLLAVAFPFHGRTAMDPTRYQPYRAVGELARVGEVGFGGFTPHQLQVLARFATVAAPRDTAPRWGQPQRVFTTIEEGHRALIVRSALGLGAGTVVRLRRLDDRGVPEYALVTGSRTVTGRAGDINLPVVWRLTLLHPVLQEWPALDTVVEPLVPHPINLNTADRAVLAALVAHLGRARGARPPHAEGRSIGIDPQPPITSGEAFAFADRILALRGDLGADPDAPPDRQPRPFAGWEDLARRWFEPMLQDTSPDQRLRWMRVYRNFLTGRNDQNNMGTAPLCFRSGPVVGYRAAASLSRNAFAGDTVAREERTGIAIALPQHALEHHWRTQVDLEEALRLGRMAPWYVTTPINTGARSNQASSGTFPAPRDPGQLLGLLFPDMGFGEPRFPSPDGNGDGFQPEPSSTPLALRGVSDAVAYESFPLAHDPLGRDLTREGPYPMGNSGARGFGPQVPSPRDHSRQWFPFTTDGGVVQSFATSFWVTPRSLGNQMLFDLAGEQGERNRVSVLLLDQHVVFEVFDEMGLDPDPGTVDTVPERPVATWKVPVADIGLRPGVAFHVNISAFGSRPTDLRLTVDNRPRGKAEFMTWLTAPLSVFDPQNRDPSRPPAEDPRYDLRIQVESTEGFPPRGVLRIGLELFEYTAIEGDAFVGRFADSMGGRMARMAAREFRPAIPVDEQGRPRINLSDLPAGTNLDVAPEHPLGALVELYGYSAAVYRNAVIQPGAGSLADSLTAFALARVGNRITDTISVTAPGGSNTITFGQGIDEDSPLREIELADPMTSPKYPPPAATAPITGAFPESGGFALVVQRRFTLTGQANPGQLSQTIEIGGLEVIQFTARQGTRLTGVSRAVRLEGDDQGGPGGVPLLYTGRRTFVTQWNPNLTVRIDGNTVPWNDLPTFLPYVVPISIKVNGSVIDPSTNRIAGINQSEWVQIYPAGDESSTEWVRYDLLMGADLVRANRRAWDRAYFEVTRQDRLQQGQVGPLGWILNDPRLANQMAYGTVDATSGYIGYVPQIESLFPQIHHVRRVLGFRGDGFTGTSSHDHAAGSTVTQCHRFELDVGNYAALTARSGRNDRVALVNGAQADGTTRPAIDWHVVNWTARRTDGDVFSDQGTISERLGPYPFQLIAFKRGVAQLFVGSAERDDFRDVRFADRLVKFPSGELPAAFPEDGAFGGTLLGDFDPVQGTIDELSTVAHRTVPLILDEIMDDGAAGFRVRPDLQLTGFGFVLVNGDLTANVPRRGGLVMIDGEILAFSAHQNGRFQVATNGRGLLGTEPRGHDEGTRVHFLTHMPAAILRSGLGTRDHRFEVQDLSSLPRHGGTVLIGDRELAHYTWTRGTDEGGVLEMPQWFDPDRDDRRGSQGLYRARYGTAAQSASSGEAVIYFPVRYWDRYHRRAVDPELAFFQLSFDQAPVLFTGIYWQEELPDQHVELQCLLRIDQRGSFDGDPAKVDGLYLLQRGEQGDASLPLFRQGRLLEARFATIYKPGAIDPGTWQAQGWKTAPIVRGVRIEYEGEGRILEEKVTAR